MNVQGLAAPWGARFRFRPLAFADAVISWRKGHWRKWEGLYPWQRELLVGVAREMADKGWGPTADGLIKAKLAIRRAISSCTGSGKTSFMIPFIVYWLLSCWPAMRILLIGPTLQHIKDHALPALKIMREASPILREMFTVTEEPRVFRNDAAPLCFATLRSAEEGTKVTGTHSQEDMVCLIFDDAAGIDDDIAKGAAGIRTDPQVIEFLFGNPLKTYGFFHDAIAGIASRHYNPIFISKKSLPTWLPEMEDEIQAIFGEPDSDT